MDFLVLMSASSQYEGKKLTGPFSSSDQHEAKGTALQLGTIQDRFHNSSDSRFPRSISPPKHVCTSPQVRIPRLSCSQASLRFRDQPGISVCLHPAHPRAEAHTQKPIRAVTPGRVQSHCAVHSWQHEHFPTFPQCSINL